MRYFLDISYDGTDYHGWQIQQNATSVQQTLNEALSTILRQDITTVGSGRTDSGVHAIQQIVHFDHELALDKKLVQGLNSLLPSAIAINEIRLVKKDISARFDAISRSYEYRIHRSKNPFLKNRSYCFSKKLDLKLMNEACEKLKIWRDFECFSKVHTQVSHFECQLTEAVWNEDNEALIFNVNANRFLRGMVRAIVGTMLDLGENKITLKAFEAILKSKDRKQAGKSAPAHGLYLKAIEYPGNIYSSLND